VDGHLQSIEFLQSFWEEILPAVMTDFLRVPWGGPEAGGVLFGRREPGSVRILAFRPLECEHAFGPAFQLSEDDQSRLRDVLEQAKTDPELAGLEAVGWYHSKPQWLLLTPYDTELWDRYFPEPWQIAMGILRRRSKPCLVELFYRQEDGSIASSHREFSVREAKPDAPLPPEPEPEPAPEPARKAEPIVPPQTCCAFWGLREMPFSPPASPQYEEVLARVMRAVRGRKGLIVLTGEAGFGKTAFLRRLGDALTRESIEFALLLDPKLSVEEFYAFLADDLALPCTQYSKVAVLKALQELLIEQARRDKTVVLVADDAHHLSGEVLEEIRMLDNLQHRTGRLLQTILCGTPEFERRLESDECRQLRQRVALRCGLQPLREEETAAYIERQLAGCGMPAQTVFTPELLSAIHARSGGVQGVTGTICNRLLELCFARATRVATIEMLEEP
jgi:general secretion pathway protein A